MCTLRSWHIIICIPLKASFSHSSNRKYVDFRLCTLCTAPLAFCNAIYAVQPLLLLRCFENVALRCFHRVGEAYANERKSADYLSWRNSSRLTRYRSRRWGNSYARIIISPTKFRSAAANRDRAITFFNRWYLALERLMAFAFTLLLCREKLFASDVARIYRYDSFIVREFKNLKFRGFRIRCKLFKISNAKRGELFFTEHQKQLRIVRRFLYEIN